MAKVVELAPKLAEEVAPKLESARVRLTDLEAQCNDAALAAALDEPGVAGRLAQLNGQVEMARRVVAQLEGAHRLALQRDAQAQAANDAKARRGQLSTMQRHADGRFKAMVKVCTALEAAAKGYAEFLDETDAMAVAMPTGLIPHGIMWRMLDIMLDGRAFPASIDVVMGGQMWRHIDMSRLNEQAGFLPGARPPTEMLRLRPAAIEPATEAVRRMNEYLVGAVREKIAAIEQADTARLSA